LEIEDYTQFRGGLKEGKRKKYGPSSIIGSKDAMLLRYEQGATNVEH